MAVGRIYINEAGPELVTVDLSTSPSYVANPNNCYGYGLEKTLQHLGLTTVRAAQGRIGARLHIGGSVGTMQDNLLSLDWCTGSIAEDAAALSRFAPRLDYQQVKSILVRLVDETLPGLLLPDALFTQAVGEVIKPFADAEMGHDLLEVHYGLTRSAYGYNLEPLMPESSTGEEL